MLRFATATGPLLLLTLLLLGPPPRAAAQETPLNEVADDREVDRILRAARAEQSRFERIRRNHLPWTNHRSGGCDPARGDERIGRFCLMHGESGSDYEPPPEAEETVEARRRLLERLGEASARVPWDGWLTGQRVRYQLEAGNAEGAAISALDCAAADWWCAALAGYVHHHAGDAARADSAYARALGSMPESVAERWLDLSPILEGRTLRDYQRLDPAARAAFLERFWNFSRLLYIRPGNDLRSEHLSRHVLDVLQYRAQSTDAISWGADLREILIRYGWPRGWERVRDTRPGLATGPPSLVSYYGTTAVQLLPPHELLFPGPDGIATGVWDVESSRPRSGYTVPAPLAATRWLKHLDHQIAIFRRPDGPRVVAAYHVPADSMPDAGEDLTAGLVVVRPDGATERVESFERGALSASLLTSLSPGPAVLSLEVLSPVAGRAGRVRTGILLPEGDGHGFGVSDLLLLRDAESLPDSLHAAVDLARGSTRVAPGESLGVYWEIYGAGATDPPPLSITLALVNRDAGWLRRTARRLGLVGEDAPIRLRWQEQGGATGYLGRAMAIRIPDAAPGSYTLELTVNRPGADPVVASRVVEITR